MTLQECDAEEGHTSKEDLERIEGDPGLYLDQHIDPFQQHAQVMPMSIGF